MASFRKSHGSGSVNVKYDVRNSQTVKLGGKRKISRSDKDSTTTPEGSISFSDESNISYNDSLASSPGELKQIVVSSCNEITTQQSKLANKSKSNEKSTNKKQSKRDLEEENSDSSDTSEELSDDRFYIEEILDTRMDKDGTRKFYVKWLHYDSSNNTWEPEENFDDSNMVKEFMDKWKQEKELKAQKAKSRPSRRRSATPVPKKRPRIASSTSSTKDIEVQLVQLPIPMIVSTEDSNSLPELCSPCSLPIDSPSSCPLPVPIVDDDDEDEDNNQMDNNALENCNPESPKRKDDMKPEPLPIEVSQSAVVINNQDNKAKLEYCSPVVSLIDYHNKVNKDLQDALEPEPEPEPLPIEIPAAAVNNNALENCSLESPIDDCKVDMKQEPETLSIEMSATAVNFAIPKKKEDLVPAYFIRTWDNKLSRVHLLILEMKAKKEEYYNVIVTDDIRGKEPEFLYGVAEDVYGNKFYLVQFAKQPYIDIVNPKSLLSKYPSFEAFFETKGAH